MFHYSKKALSLFVLLTMTAFFAAYAQYETTTPQTTAGTKVRGNVSISADLIDEDAMAKQKMVIVNVTVSGVNLAVIPPSGTRMGAEHHTGMTTGSTTGTTGTAELPDADDDTMADTDDARTRDDLARRTDPATGAAPGRTTPTETRRTSGAKMHAHSAGPHIHYQIDNGPIIATPVTTLTFANLTTGSHTIKVFVADPSHKAISETETLTVRIP